MKMNNKAFSNCLRKLAEQIDKMPASFLEELADGNFDIKIENINNKNKKNVQLNRVSDNYEFNQIESALRAMQSREEGLLFLSKKKLNKNRLMMLAKYLDLPVQHSENIKHISEKIIETTIGYKLRSQAIRGYIKDDKNNIINVPI